MGNEMSCCEPEQRVMHPQEQMRFVQSRQQGDMEVWTMEKESAALPPGRFLASRTPQMTSQPVGTRMSGRDQRQNVLEDLDKKFRYIGSPEPVMPNDYAVGVQGGVSMPSDFGRRRSPIPTMQDSYAMANASISSNDRRSGGGVSFDLASQDASARSSAPSLPKGRELGRDDGPALRQQVAPVAPRAMMEPVQNHGGPSEAVQKTRAPRWGSSEPVSQRGELI
mmetsp:Transcript_43478/g.68079  ORF Transcript_43478/g.68079 Transcript_43478/m.68079 type:complete len:223 (-) Transcript_43478:142-810(-)|eukprot:CAMPEP_0184306768 /NCGR_PEP_ID=MMETSP1049-20130417/15680_1 /TAXON_ID=77928 /ORGANISM="Proteomonas sulcata, Strain CCMP704" /LENGTH=222 /DNA_ID=CAMNT_0026619099 /DNA_START=65 /DNA_END=733 /DNA_ORIENTATION=+